MKWDYQETARLCRGLSLMLHAGIGLADGAYLLSQEEKGSLREGLETLGRSLDAGDPLAQAAEDCGLFPGEAAGMLYAGQQTGRLEEALSHLAEHYDQRVRSTRQIKNALAYPSLVLALMLGVIIVLLVKVLPVFESVYASLGSGMTGFAGSLLGLGALVEGAVPGLLAAAVLGLGLWLMYRYVAPVQEKVSQWFLNRFGDRGFLRKFNNAQFARALAMGLGSGLSLEESLELAERLLGHIPGAAARCQICREALEAGAGLTAALEQGRLLPPAQSRMLALGLKSGSGDQVMGDIAQRLHEDAYQSLENVVSRVEPAMVLVCSALVGLILLAVMLPLMNILSAIG